jgi:diphthine-ammonia ligase
MTELKDWKNGASGHKFIASFSGGKDSVLALYKARKDGEALGLIVMLEEEGKRSRSHGMPPKLIHAQAKSIGLPVYTAAASWTDYEKVFMQLLEKAKNQGAEVLVTGDLDMPAHGCWHEKVTKNAGLKLGMPLWEMNHREAVEEFINLGFETIIVTVNLSLGMSEDDLGRTLTYEYVKELEARGIDPCGEGGEFHTTVIDGPIFKHPIPVRKCAIIKDGEYAFLPLELDQMADMGTL